MSGEKQNDRNGLQNKLDALQCLPGEPGLDKLQSWSNLYSRLHKKPARGNRAWYAIAAACVLIVFSFVFLMRSGRVKPDALPGSVISGAIKPAAPDSALKYKPSSFPVMGAEIRKPVPVVAKRRPIKPVPIRQNLLVMQTPSIGGDSQSAGQPIPLFVPDPPIAGNSTEVRKKKRFRVVSLNELDEPTEENLSGYSARRGLRLKWLAPPNPDASSLRSGNAGYDLLKINLYTPN